MNISPCDFEWRSGTEISRGLPLYFADPESAPLCLSYTVRKATVDYPAVIENWAPHIHGRRCPEWLADHLKSGGKIRAWNALFEFYCFEWLHKNWGWPAVTINQFVCTMAEAAAMNLPQSLDFCGHVLGMAEEVRKSSRGRELIKLLCIPQKEPLVKEPKKYRSDKYYATALRKHDEWLELGGRWRNDADLLEEMRDYCTQDVVAETANAKKLLRLSPFEQLVWLKTQEINLRGVPVDVAEIDRILKVVEWETERLNTELRTITEGEVPEATNRNAMFNWCNERLPRVVRDVETPISEEDQLQAEVEGKTIEPEIKQVEGPFLLDLQAETLEAVLKLTDIPTKVRRVIELRLIVNQTSIAKLYSMRDNAAPDGTLKNMLVYHGASTGRYVSRGGVNLQNIARPTLKEQDVEIAHATLGTGDPELCHLVWGDKLMDAAVATVRGVLRAPEGYEFVDADYSSIENRVASWLAGQLDKLDLFAQGFDEYKVFASTSLFDVPYDLVDGYMRQVSKSAVLGCMFGQGARGLVNYALIFGVVLTLKRAQEIVNAYRKQYSKVKELWYHCGNQSINAVRNPDVWFECGSKMRIMCTKSRSFLVLELPSGRCLRWCKPMVQSLRTPWGEYKDVVTVEGTNSKTHQWQRDKLIGSSIFQSGVQATARDIQVFGMLQAEDAGYPTVLLVHDEDLALVKKGFGSAEGLGALICRKDEWFLDLPLAFEGWVSPRYHK